MANVLGEWWMKSFQVHINKSIWLNKNGMEKSVVTLGLRQQIVCCFGGL